jgi:hypothetical protein
MPLAFLALKRILDEIEPGLYVASANVRIAERSTWLRTFRNCWHLCATSAAKPYMYGHHTD